MKMYLRTLFIVLFALCSVPSLATAHVALEMSHPADGSEAEQAVEQIELTFSGEVLTLSTMTVIDQNGAEITPAEVVAEGKTVTALLAAPLPDGDYTVNWNVVAADGHVLQGELAFAVAAAETETETAEPEPADEAPAASEEPAEAGEPPASGTPEDERGQFVTYAPVALGAAVIILIGLLAFLLRPKRAPK